MSKFKLVYNSGGKLDVIKPLSSFTIPYSKGTYSKLVDGNSISNTFTFGREVQLRGFSVVIPGKYSPGDSFDLWIGEMQIINSMRFNHMHSSVISEINFKSNILISKDEKIRYSYATESGESKNIFCNFHLLIKDGSGGMPEIILDSSGGLIYRKEPSEADIAKPGKMVTPVIINSGWFYNDSAIAGVKLNHTVIPFPYGIGEISSVGEYIVSIPSKSPKGGYIEFDITCNTKVLENGSERLKPGAGKVQIFMDDKLIDVITFPQNNLDQKYYFLGWNTIRYRGKLALIPNSSRIRIHYIHTSTNENAFIYLGDIKVKINS